MGDDHLQAYLHANRPSVGQMLVLFCKIKSIQIDELGTDLYYIINCTLYDVTLWPFFEHTALVIFDFT